MYVNVRGTKNNKLKKIYSYKLISNILIEIHFSSKVPICFISNLILKD